MWRRTADGAYLYSFSHDARGYALTYTDLAAVYAESLRGAALLRRADELGCPFALAEAPARFLAVLAEALRTATFAPAGVRADFAFTGVPFVWTCAATPLAGDAAARVLGALAQELLGALGGLGRAYNAELARGAQKSALVRGLADAVQRKVWYRVPTALLGAYDDGADAEPLPADPVALAEAFWPAERRSVLAAASSSESLASEGAAAARDEAEGADDEAEGADDEAESADDEAESADDEAESADGEAESADGEAEGAEDGTEGPDGDDRDETTDGQGDTTDEDARMEYDSDATQ